MKFLSLKTSKRIERRDFFAKREGEAPTGAASEGGADNRYLENGKRI
jgi:hypothetical protein